MTARRSRDASKSTSVASSSTIMPAAIPPANVWAAMVSRNGSRNATIVISPIPQRIMTAGSSTGSSSLRRQRRTT